VPNVSRETFKNISFHFPENGDGKKHIFNKNTLFFLCAHDMMIGRKFERKEGFLP